MSEVMRTPELARERPHFERLQKLAESVKRLFESEEIMHSRVKQEAAKFSHPEKTEPLLLDIEQRARTNRRIAKSLLLGVTLALGKMMTGGAEAEIEVPKPLGELAQKHTKEKPAKKEDWSWVEESRVEKKSQEKFEAVKQLLATTIVDQKADEEVSTATAFESQGFDTEEAAELADDLAMRWHEVETVAYLESEARKPQVSEHEVQMDLWFKAQAFSISHGIDQTVAFHHLGELLKTRAYEISWASGRDGVTLEEKEQKFTLANKLRYAAGVRDIKLSDLIASN